MSDDEVDDFFRSCAGLFVGLLTNDELALFDRLVAEGKAHRSYEGGAGFMGLAKVRKGP